MSATKNSQNSFLDSFWYLHRWMGAATHKSQTDWKSKNYSHMAFKYSPESTWISLVKCTNKRLDHLFCETESIIQKQDVWDGGSSCSAKNTSVIMLCQRFKQSRLVQFKSHSKKKGNLPCLGQNHCPFIMNTYEKWVVTETKKTTN